MEHTQQTLIETEKQRFTLYRESTPARTAAHHRGTRTSFKLVSLGTASSQQRRAQHDLIYSASQQSKLAELSSVLPWFDCYQCLNLNLAQVSLH